MLENRAGNCTVTERSVKMKVTDLDTRDVTVTRTEKRYVLNEKVFQLDNCPDWAQYAAVDEDGQAYWCSSKPGRVGNVWLNAGRNWLIEAEARTGANVFDATDWQHSLIKRPEKVHEVTMADLENKFGCKVKIVKCCGTKEKVDVTSEAAVATSSNLSTDVYKLDTQVFLLDRCPYWAKWAAVDHDGIASWYSTKPVLGSDKRWRVPRGVLGCCMPIERVGAGQYMRFDSSSYYDSLVEKKACLSQYKARKANA